MGDDAAIATPRYDSNVAGDALVTRDLTPTATKHEMFCTRFVGWKSYSTSNTKTESILQYWNVNP